MSFQTLIEEKAGLGVRVSDLTKEELKKRLHEQYWTCFDCADKYGAESDGGCHTCSVQTCGLCGEKKTCNAITDWYWPKEFNVGYIWD